MDSLHFGGIEKREIGCDLMAFNYKQFKGLVREVLSQFDTQNVMTSDSAINLILGTCAQESLFGTYIRQLNNGPGLGVFSFERNTEIDMWQHYLQRKKEISKQLSRVCGVVGPDNNFAMIWNLAYQIIMVRLYYWRDPTPLPEANDVYALGEYWNRVYNKNPEKGTTQDFMRNYKKYCQ